MIPAVPRWVRWICFVVMLLIGIEIFCFGLASRRQEAPLRQIAHVPLWLIHDISLGVWTMFTLIFGGITFHYAKLHPFFATFHLVAILAMMAFFTTSLHFDPFDLHIWGPFATDLSIIVSTGIEATYNSADRGIARRARDFVMGNENNGDSGNNNDDDSQEINVLRPNGRRRSISD